MDVPRWQRIAFSTWNRKPHRNISKFCCNLLYAMVFELQMVPNDSRLFDGLLGGSPCWGLCNQQTREASSGSLSDHASTSLCCWVSLHLRFSPFLGDFRCKKRSPCFFCASLGKPLHVIQGPNCVKILSNMPSKWEDKAGLSGAKGERQWLLFVSWLGVFFAIFGMARVVLADGCLGLHVESRLSRPATNCASRRVWFLCAIYGSIPPPPQPYRIESILRLDCCLPNFACSAPLPVARVRALPVAWKRRRRKRGGGGGGDEADVKSNNLHLTDTQRGWCHRGCFEMSWWGSLEVK